MTNKTKSDVAQHVRDAISQVPPLDDIRLDVDTGNIIATEVGGKTWWRVPVVPTPFPRRLSPLYEVMAEIEGVLQDEQGLDILLFAGDASEPEPTASALSA